jgi:hypothetical protein
MAGDRIGDVMTGYLADGLKAKGRARHRCSHHLHGLIQVSCGLTVPLPDRAGTFEQPSSHDVAQFHADLTTLTCPTDGAFSLAQIPAAGPADPPHTHLFHMSRHIALVPAPEAIPPSLEWRASPPSFTWRNYLRFQRTRDSGAGDPDAHDCTDYCVTTTCPARSPGEQALTDLRDFIATLFACRRGAIFVSNLSDRMYHVWLPPGLLTPHVCREQPAACGSHRDGASADDRRGVSYAVLPFITIVRRPYSYSWRRAMTLTCVFVPWSADLPGDDPALADHREPPTGPVNFQPADVVSLVAATGGATTYIRDLTDLFWNLPPSPLWRYLAAFTADRSRPLTARLTRTFLNNASMMRQPSAAGGATETRGEPANPDARPAAFRAWFELLLTIVREPSRPYRDRLSAAEPDPDFAVSVDVLQAMRLTSMWSCVLVSDRLAVAKETRRPAGDTAAKSWTRWRRLPGPVRTILQPLTERDGWFLPAPDYPTDHPPTGSRKYLTWCLQRERVLLTVYSRSEDRFPGPSSLSLFAWLAHMLLGITSARQIMRTIMEEVTRETSSGSPDMATVAHSVHRSFLELEELYDLDSAWPTYRLFCQRLRELTGLEGEYQRIRDRIELLTHFSESELRVSDERKDQRLALIGGVLAGSIAFASVASVLVSLASPTKTPTAWLYPSLAGLAGVALLIGFLIYRSVRRRTRSPG